MRIESISQTICLRRQLLCEEPKLWIGANMPGFAQAAQGGACLSGGVERP